MKTWTAKKVSFGLTVVVGLTAAGAMGDGLRNPPDGAFSVSRFGGKIAQVDDVSAVEINPANIMGIDAPTYEASLTLSYGKKEFEDLTGAKAETEDPWAVLPSLFAVWPVKQDGVRVGFGISSPFGRSTRYEKDSAIRYTNPYFVELRTVNFNPVVAIKARDNVQVAVGLDVLYSDFNIDQFYPWALATGDLTAPDGKASFEGDGVGFGGNAAVSWEMVKSHTLALTYRSSIKVDYEGDTHISNIPDAGKLPLPLSVVSARSDFETEVEFPSVIGIGYGWDVNEKLSVGVDYEWIEHSLFDELELDVGNNAALLPSTTIPADWDDNWTLGFGLDYKLNDLWTARAGYMYVETPVPSETMTPFVAEEDQSVISVGLGYEKDARRVDLAYAYGIFDGREVSDNVNPANNGKYDFESHLVAVSYQVEF